MRVEFVTSAPGLAQRPERVLPEFAFVGRSNCGKSSLINHVLARKAMAKISGKPGKTRLLNYFLVEDTYYLVDLPGYGFARVGKDLREEWLRLMRAYLFVGDRPLAVLQLLDVRHRPTEEDRRMTTWLREAGVPFAIAVTKIDKLGKTKLPERFREIAATLELDPATPFLPTSAAGGLGRDEILAWFAAILADGGEPADGGTTGR